MLAAPVEKLCPLPKSSEPAGEDGVHCMTIQHIHHHLPLLFRSINMLLYMSLVNKLSNVFSCKPVQIIFRVEVCPGGKLYAQPLF